jgi:hypothetical protein
MKMDTINLKHEKKTDKQLLWHGEYCSITKYWTKSLVIFQGLCGYVCSIWKFLFTYSKNSEYLMLFWNTLVGERWVKYIRIVIYVYSGTRWYNFSGFHSGYCSYHDGTLDFLNPVAKLFCSNTWKQLVVSIFKMNLDQWNVSMPT